MTNYLSIVLNSDEWPFLSITAFNPITLLSFFLLFAESSITQNPPLVTFVEFNYNLSLLLPVGSTPAYLYDRSLTTLLVDYKLGKL